MLGISDITSGTTQMLGDVAKEAHDNALLEAAGCREGGKLLSKQACINLDYQAYEAPDEATVVYHTITHQEVVEVKEEKKQIKLDIKMEQVWEDPRIKTNFSTLDKIHGRIRLPWDKVLGSNQLPIIWNPWYHDFHIRKMSSIKSHFGDSQNWWTGLNLLYNSPLHENVTLVKLSLEFIVTIFCGFDYDGYPMDTETCEFRVATSPYKILRLLLHDPERYHSETRYEAVGFKITTSFVNANVTPTHALPTEIGFDIVLKRIVQPFLFQFYLPCIAIVLVSQTSFIVPLSAIPGRIALVVTQFLTLINIYIHQQVYCGNML